MLMQKEGIAMKRMLCLLLTLILLAGGMGETRADSSNVTHVSGYYGYSLNADGTATIEEYSGNAVWLTVPSILDGRKVTGIGGFAFSSCHDLVELVLPEGIKNIEILAFMTCDNLASITLPDSLESVGEGLFEYCGNLKSVTLPKGLREMDGNPLTNCSAKVSVSKENPYYFELDGAVVDLRSAKLVIFADGVQRKEYTVPGVKSIAEEAFAMNKALTSVTLTEGVESIGERAFFSCEKLAVVKLPYSLREISGNPFLLTPAEFKIASGHPYFAVVDGVLMDKAQTRIIAYPYDSRRTKYVMPKGITAIGDDAFNSCEHLNAIVLPEGLKSIGNLSFSGCSGLNAVTLPEGLISIGALAFSDCRNLKSIKLPQSLSTLEAAAFGACTSLSSVSFSTGLKSIGARAFVLCSGLRSLTLPEGLESIGDAAFYQCTNLKSVKLPKSLSSIASNAFLEDANLTLTVYRGSYAARWAQQQGVKYRYAD